MRETWFVFQGWIFKKDNISDVEKMSDSNDMVTRLNYAKEIIKEMGRKENTIESIEETAERLNKIYG